MSYQIPLTDMVKLLIPTRELTDEDWCQIIEKRLALIKPHLKTLPLIRLGNFSVFADSGCLKPLANYNPRAVAINESEKNKYSLSTLGVYFIVRKFTVMQKNLIRTIWGISRYGQWLKIQCYFEQTEGIDRYGKFDLLTIETTDTQTIIELNDQKPKAVLSRLHNMIEEWREKRAGLFNTAQTIAHQVALENQLLQLIESTKEKITASSSGE